MIEELKEDRNQLIEELEKREQQLQEHSCLLEQVTAELNKCEQDNEYLKLEKEAASTTRRRLESKIIELQQEFHTIRSTYSRSRAYGMAESSAVSHSAYDSNRNFAASQVHLNHDTTQASPMAHE